jgi:hypothetical protein
MLDDPVAAPVTGRIDAGYRSTLVRLPFARSPLTAPARIEVTVTAPEPVTMHLEVTPQPSRILGDVIVLRGQPAPTAPLRAVADFQFRRTERVRLEWQVRAPLAQRTARLLTRQGQSLPVPVTLTEIERDGRQILAADLVAAPLAEGDYVVELAVGIDASAVETRFVAVRITR